MDRGFGENPRLILDSKIIDIRTGKKVSGVDLSYDRITRNKNLNTKNLRKYRGAKILKGQRRIRKEKYFYQPNDLVKYDGKVYTVKVTQNEGKYIALKEIKKIPKVELLTPYIFKKRLNCSYGLCYNAEDKKCNQQSVKR